MLALRLMMIMNLMIIHGDCGELHFKLCCLGFIANFLMAVKHIFLFHINYFLCFVISFLLCAFL